MSHWFKKPINPSRVISCLWFMELHSLFIFIYIFHAVASRGFFFLHKLYIKYSYLTIIIQVALTARVSLIFSPSLPLSLSLSLSLSLPIFLSIYHSTPLTVLPNYILCPYRVDVNRFLLVGQNEFVFASPVVSRLHCSSYLDVFFFLEVEV